MLTPCYFPLENFAFQSSRSLQIIGTHLGILGFMSQTFELRSMCASQITNFELCNCCSSLQGVPEKAFRKHEAYPAIHEGTSCCLQVAIHLRMHTSGIISERTNSGEHQSIENIIKDADSATEPCARGFGVKAGPLSARGF